MPITEKERQAIAARETEQFIKEQSEEQFAQVDLRGMPHLHERLHGAPDQGVDQRFAPLVGDEPYAKVGKSLREFLSHPDDDALNSAAKYDPAIRADQLDKLGEREATEFMRRNPDYYPDEDNHNYQAVVVHVASAKLPKHSFPNVESAQKTLLEKGLFTAENLSESFRVLWERGALVPEPGTPRRLRESELREVVAHANSWGVPDGIMTYMKLALGELPEEADNYQDVSDFLSRNSELAGEACRFVFFSLEPVTDSDEFREFEAEFFRDKRLRTYQLYKECWGQFERQQRTESIFQSQPDEQPTTPLDLDELNDREIEQMMRQTTRARAKANRKSPGILA